MVSRHKLPWWWMRFRITPTVVGAALATNLVFHEIFGTKMFFWLFIVAVGVAAHYEGWGAGLLATVMAALALLYFFIPPVLSFSVSEPYDWARLTVFVLASILASTEELLVERARIRRVETLLRRVRTGKTGHE